MCVFTVVSLMKSSLPISAFESPRATRRKTSSSRSVNVCDTAAAPWSWELTARENPAYPATAEDCSVALAACSSAVASSSGPVVIPASTNSTKRGQATEVICSWGAAANVSS